jgi:hypothetical protein
LFLAFLHWWICGLILFAWREGGKPWDNHCLIWHLNRALPEYNATNST